MKVQELIESLQNLIKSGKMEPDDNIMMAIWDKTEQDVFYAEIDTFAQDGCSENSVMICNREYIPNSYEDWEIVGSKTEII